MLTTWRAKRRSLRETKAVIAVHLYGQTVPMTSLGVKSASGQGIVLIEDAAQAQGARYEGETLREDWAILPRFSFYPGKESGCLRRRRSNHHSTTAKSRNTFAGLPTTAAGASKYEHVEIGYNFRMDEIQGVVLKYRSSTDWTNGTPGAVSWRRTIAPI